MPRGLKDEGERMSFLTLLAPALFEIAGLATPEMVCAFRPTDDAAATTVVRIIDNDLEMTTTGQYKIALALDGERVPGRVVAYEKSEARDVVMRARTSDRTVYLIALRDDGTALMRFRPVGDGTEVVTRSGSCAKFERFLDKWLED